MGRRETRLSGIRERATVALFPVDRSFYKTIPFYSSPISVPSFSNAKFLDMLSWNESLLMMGLSLPVLALVAWAYLVRSEIKQDEEKKKLQ